MAGPTCGHLADSHILTKFREKGPPLCSGAVCKVLCSALPAWLFMRFGIACFLFKTKEIQVSEGQKSCPEVLVERGSKYLRCRYSCSIVPHRLLIHFEPAIVKGVCVTHSFFSSLLFFSLLFLRQGYHEDQAGFEVAVSDLEFLKEANDFGQGLKININMKIV